MKTADEILKGARACRDCHLPVYGTGGYRHRDCARGARQVVDMLAGALREHEDKGSAKRYRAQIEKLKGELAEAKKTMEGMAEQIAKDKEIRENIAESIARLGDFGFSVGDPYHGE